MSRTELKAKLDEIRAVREQALTELQDLPDADTAVATEGLRLWSTVSVALLRFGDHMREHANQVSGARQGVEAHPSDVQRKLAEAERAWGHLLAATVGLTDQDLDRSPGDGEWSVRETLDHILAAETRYLEGIRAGLRSRGSEAE